MGTGKKEASRRERQGKTQDLNIKVKGENFYRTAKRAKQLKIENGGKTQRNADGKIVKAAIYQSRDVPTAVVEPNRKWFTNSRVISQESLQAFRTAMDEQSKDPNRFLLKSAKLPMSLIRDEGSSITKKKKQQAVLVESYSDVFGPKATRKRVTNESYDSFGDFASSALAATKAYNTQRSNLIQHGIIAAPTGGDGEAGDDVHDMDHVPPEVGHEEPEAPAPSALLEPVFSKGQSRRIWNELYRTIDSSDVIIHVLDARDPLGTTCRSVEDYLRKEAPHKHLIYILNKCDLVPSSVAARWVKTLRKTVPTCAFRASVTNPFGKGSLITLLRQFSSLHADRKQISVGMVGYPNVGKSSVLNTLLGKKTCTVAPIPGETKVWQFVRLMKRIYLIDCPGIVPPDQNATAEDILLRGAVRTEKIYNPAQYIAGVLKRTKKHHVARTYELKDWTDAADFLELLARKRGRLMSGGEADIDGMARIVLNDFLRGKIPWFTAPPQTTPEEDKEGMGDRAGRLGEMPKKRKRDDAESEVATSMGASTPGSTVTKEGDDEEDATAAKKNEEDAADDFEGFGSDSAPSDLSDEDDMISLGSLSDEDEDEDEDSEDAEEEDGDEAEDDEEEEDGNSDSDVSDAEAKVDKAKVSGDAGRRSRANQGPKSKRQRR